CCIAMAELLTLQNHPAIAYSKAPTNYSVCRSLITKAQIADVLPPEISPKNVNYIITDVSDPDFLKDSVPLDRVTAVYDHHTGFESYWQSRIGENAHIEFLGAAATLIYREWKKAGLQDRMSRSTALLLIAAILDNTLNLTSSNTTPEDVETFKELCRKENIGEDWCASYFTEVQANVEADLQNALLNDTKTVRNNNILPPRVSQITVWNAQSILERLTEIRQWFGDKKSWMINIIDIQHCCSYFVCDDEAYQQKISQIFDIQFTSGVAKTPVSYLRKEIIKKTQDFLKTLE
ncbi:MAG: DHH family protein, partial [Clostridia bacterium]|nr:DHH family protein [Clostridia bacterium]